jgi:hypothetical protein
LGRAQEERRSRSAACESSVTGEKTPFQALAITENITGGLQSVMSQVRAVFLNGSLERMLKDKALNESYK